MPTTYRLWKDCCSFEHLREDAWDFSSAHCYPELLELLKLNSSRESTQHVILKANKQSFGESIGDSLVPQKSNKMRSFDPSIVVQANSSRGRRIRKTKKSRLFDTVIVSGRDDGRRKKCGTQKAIRKLISFSWNSFSYCCLFYLMLLLVSCDRREDDFLSRKMLGNRMMLSYKKV